VTRLNTYAQIIAHIFQQHYQPGVREIFFTRPDLIAAAQIMDLHLPKNLGDIVYSFKFRYSLPQSIAESAPPGLEWTLQQAGISRYVFKLVPPLNAVPNPSLLRVKIPDSTPGLVSMYAQNDEQALLARIRYNRLLDIFVRAACYSLQNHLRTAVRGLGQIETDELYVGVGVSGTQFVFPIQAKSTRDKLGEAQIRQDLALCTERFPSLVARPIGAQWLEPSVLAMFEFVLVDGDIRIAAEKHYQLVSPVDISTEDLLRYRQSLEP